MRGGGGNFYDLISANSEPRILYSEFLISSCISHPTRAHGITVKYAVWIC